MANQQYDRHTYAAHILGLLQRTIEIKRGFGAAISSRYQSQVPDVVYPFLDRGHRVLFRKLRCNHTYNDDNRCNACGAVVRDASTQPLSIRVPADVSQGEVMARINVYKAHDILSNMTNARRRWRRRDPGAPVYTPADALLAQINLNRIHLCFTWVQLRTGQLEATHVPLVDEGRRPVPNPVTWSYNHHSSVSIAMGSAYTGVRKRVIDCIVPVCTFFFLHCNVL
jgi:hypothetical protein